MAKRKRIDGFRLDHAAVKRETDARERAGKQSLPAFYEGLPNGTIIIHSGVPWGGIPPQIARTGAQSPEHFIPNLPSPYMWSGFITIALDYLRESFVLADVRAFPGWNAFEPDRTAICGLPENVFLLLKMRFG